MGRGTELFVRYEGQPLWIREFAEGDYPAYTALWNRTFPKDPVSEEEFRIEDGASGDSQYRPIRYAVEARGDSVPVAFSGYRRNLSSSRDPSYWFELVVRDGCRRRGIGSELFERLLGELRGRAAGIVRTSTAEIETGSIEFLERRGFRECRRVWESDTDPSEVDAEAFRPLFERLEREGIRVRSIAEEVGDRDEGWDRLYRLEAETGADMPRLDPYEPVPRADFDAATRRNPSFLPAGGFVAVEDRRYVASTWCTRVTGVPGLLRQQYTGVLRTHRGRGIATALKVRLLEYARREGFAVVRAFNDSTNAPMLSVNARLGYRRRLGWISFERRLTGGAWDGYGADALGCA